VLLRLYICHPVNLVTSITLVKRPLASNIDRCPIARLATYGATYWSMGWLIIVLTEIRTIHSCTQCHYCRLAVGLCGWQHLASWQGVLIGGGDNCLPLNFRLWERKFSPKTQNFGVGKFSILGGLRGKVKILGTQSVSQSVLP